MISHVKKGYVLVWTPSEGTYTINLKLIKIYQWLEPITTAKYKTGTYQQGYFPGVCNIDLKLITCKDNIVILSILQSYVLHWYHMYLLHPGMDKTEAMILQHLYCTNIRDAVRKEVTHYKTCQRKINKIKYMVHYQLISLRKYHVINSV